MKLPFQLCLCLSLITFAVTQYWHSGRRWINRFFPVKDLGNFMPYFNIMQQDLEDLHINVDKMKKECKTERDDQQTQLDRLKIESGQCKAGIAGLEKTLKGLTSVPADPCSSKMCGDNAFCVRVQMTAICQCLDGFVVGEGQIIETNGCVEDPVVACAAAGGNICTVIEPKTCTVTGSVGANGCGDLPLFRESTVLFGPTIIELLKCYFGDPLPDQLDAVYFSNGDDSSNLCKSVKALRVGISNGFSFQSGECSNFANDGSAIALCTLP